MRTFIFAIAASLLSVANGFGQAMSLSQTLDKASMAFEDSAKLEITLTWPGSQLAYYFDKPVQPQLDRLKIQGYATSISSAATAQGEVTTKRFQFTLVPTSAGQGRIDPFTISYVHIPDSLPGGLTTSALTIQISDPIPRKQPANVENWRLKWSYILAICVTLLGVLALIIVKSRNKRPYQPVKSPVDAFLDRLGQAKTEANGDLRRFQAGLYKILLVFLGEQYGLNIAGLSTAEVIEQMESTNLSAGLKEKISGWLMRAEREKFAPLPPTPGETIRLEQEIREQFELLKAMK